MDQLAGYEFNLFEKPYKVDVNPRQVSFYSGLSLPYLKNSSQVNYLEKRNYSGNSGDDVSSVKYKKIFVPRYSKRAA